MATLQELETALRNADKAGDMDAARKLAAVVIQARGEASSQIPGAEIQGTQAQQAPRSLLDRIKGIGETGLTLATGATGGTIGALGGVAKTIGQNVLYGQSDGLEKNVVAGMQAGTYMPRSEAGQEYVGDIGQLASNLPPVIPQIAGLNAIGQAARQQAPLMGATAQRAAQATRQAGQAVAAPVGRVVQAGREALALEPVPASPSMGARVSGGAAATPLELQRAAEAEMAGLKLSEGEVKRFPELLAWEKEKAKTPEFQAPFLERQQANNRAAIAKLDQVLDDTGAETGNVTDTGIKAVDVLMKGWKEEKQKTSALYEKFYASPEAQLKVDATPVLDFLNDQPMGISGQTGVSDFARQTAEKIGKTANSPDSGLAFIDENGRLIANPNATLGQLEDFRKAVSQASAITANDKRLISDIKTAIDQVGNPIGGELTKAMRAQRQRTAQKYENRAIVSRLLSDKRGSDDPKVPIEDVFQKTILTARPSEIQHVKRVLSTIGGDEGQQAWKELQGATVRHIMESAENGIGSDNLPVISAAKLDKTLKTLDKNGKLDLVLGKSNAEQVRNLNQVLQYIQSTPPLTSINNSGTARTVVALMAESAVQGAATGIPLPILQGMKMLKNEVSDRRIKARIQKSLNYNTAQQKANP